MNLNYLKSYKDLVTTHEQTRAGFINFAIEKNRKANPLIQQAKVLHVHASKAKQPEDLLNMTDIQKCLLTASGLSDKSLNYFTDADKKQAIQKLIKDFLKPAGEKFVDELVYRFMLFTGDSLGGAMRNLIGELAQSKLILTFISSLAIFGIKYRWFNNKTKKWITGNPIEPDVKNVKAIYWIYKGKHRVLAFNLNISVVKNNVDICLFDCNEEEYGKGKIAKNCNEVSIMFGELKGGIDPAGADEHWKTGRTALGRIKTAFAKIHREDIRISFIAAAIQEKMGEEIYDSLLKRELSFAANLTIEEQVAAYCKWIIEL